MDGGGVDDVLLVDQLFQRLVVDLRVVLDVVEGALVVVVDGVAGAFADGDDDSVGLSLPESPLASAEPAAAPAAAAAAEETDESCGASAGFGSGDLETTVAPVVVVGAAVVVVDDDVEGCCSVVVEVGAGSVGRSVDRSAVTDLESSAGDSALVASGFSIADGASPAAGEFALLSAPAGGDASLATGSLACSFLSGLTSVAGAAGATGSLVVVSTGCGLGVVVVVVVGARSSSSVIFFVSLSEFSLSDSSWSGSSRLGAGDDSRLSLSALSPSDLLPSAPARE